MEFIKNQFAWWAIGAVLLCATFLSASGVSAQQASDTVSLGISPQVLDVTANPGETLTNTFRLTNASQETVEVEAIAKNFVPRGEDGAVDLTIDDTSFSLADWIESTPSSATMGSSMTQDFEISISVPSDAEPGSHFGSIVFATKPPEQPGASALISQEIAPVILVRIAGDTVEAADIAEFKAEKSLYTTEDAVTFLSRIENTGNVHFKPTAKIVVENMFGSQVAELEVERRNVLPASVRQLKTEWVPEGLKIGRYTATLSVVYGDNDEVKLASTTVTYFPWQVILPIVLLIAFVGFVIVRFRRRIGKAVAVLRGKDVTNSKES